MPKSANQKLKLLYLMRILLRHSDEAHPLTVQDMIDELEKYGISAERKSIYDDMESLQQFGLDIIKNRGRHTEYYVASREFELPELQLLVDSVQSSRFITQRKTLDLIKKIEGLANEFDAQLLHRQVYVRNRVKSMNESVYYNVDSLSAAISRNRRVRFQYFEFNVKKERQMRHDGAEHEVSPYALIWDNENYYLLAYDAAAGLLKHYRVDKMLHINETEEPREGREAFASVDMSAYTSRVFGMFTGEEHPVTIRFAAHLAGAVIDRFGSGVMLIPQDDDTFTVTVKAVVSPRFLSWVFGFGTEAAVLSPPTVREDMKKMLQESAAMYE